MTRAMFYGVVAVLFAAILVTSSLAVAYYNRSQDQASSSLRYAQELKAALSKYDSLAATYGVSLQDLKTTLTLLTDAVANLNTSSSSYRSASLALGSLWNSYRTLAALNGTRPASYSVDILVRFGNGTRAWHNGTAVEPGWNGYVVTLVGLSGRVQAAWFPQYQEHLVTGIDGVASSGSDSWFVWTYGGGRWQPAQTGADGIRVYNGTLLAWTLCGYDANFNPKCQP